MNHFDHNGKQIVFDTVTGNVSGAHKHGETVITGSGGGGFNGRTSDINIRSHTIVKQEFFIKQDGGKQVPVKLSAEDIPLMDDQKVTMISGSNGKNSVWTHLVNHHADLYWNLGNSKVHTITWGLVRQPLVSFFIGVALWIAGAYLFNGVIGFLAAAGFWVFEWKNLTNASKALQMHLDSLGKEALSRSTVP